MPRQKRGIFVYKQGVSKFTFYSHLKSLSPIFARLIINYGTRKSCALGGSDFKRN
jgi:hypothetical protein